MQKRGRIPQAPTNTDCAAFFYIILGGLSIVSITLSILAFSASLSHISFDVVGVVASQSRFALYDDRRQSVQNSSWTVVQFNRQRHLSTHWRYTPGTGTVECLKEGTYIVHFGLTVTSPTNQTNTSFACLPCNVWVMAQCTVNNITRPESVIFQKPAKGLVQASITVDTRVGDLLRIEFKSHCTGLSLGNNTWKRLVSHNEPLASASLLIY